MSASRHRMCAHFAITIWYSMRSLVDTLRLLYSRPLILEYVMICKLSLVNAHQVPQRHKSVCRRYVWYTTTEYNQFSKSMNAACKFSTTATRGCSFNLYYILLFANMSSVNDISIILYGLIS